jgi:4'-phosphopantetheinyl transferase
MVGLPEQADVHAGVDLWCIELEADPAGADEPILSADERKRAARFVFHRDRERFIAAHAALRRVLARYAGRDAAELRFAADPNGRPRLIGEFPFDFNLSHSGALALIGVAARGPIGADIEVLRPVEDADAIASRVFSASEAAAIAAVDPAQRDRAFLTCWTRKEAFLKALGLGLIADTRCVEVGVEPDPRRVVLPPGAASAGSTVELTVATRDVHESAVAALAIAGAAPVFHYKRRSLELRSPAA